MVPVDQIGSVFWLFRQNIPRATSKLGLIQKDRWWQDNVPILSVAAKVAEGEIVLSTMKIADRLTIKSLLTEKVVIFSGCQARADRVNQHYYECSYLLLA